jgi:hypothetical protein
VRVVLFHSFVCFEKVGALPVYQGLKHIAQEYSALLAADVLLIDYYFARHLGVN